MQEETNFKIEIKQLDDFDEQKNILAIITILNNSLKEIQDLLFIYHYDKRERVYDLSIDSSSVTFNGSNGSFVTYYMIGFFNACADLDYNAKEKMKISFNINRDTSEIHLVGEHWPERGQDEI